MTKREFHGKRDGARPRDRCPGGKAGEEKDIQRPRDALRRTAAAAAVAIWAGVTFSGTAARRSEHGEGRVGDRQVQRGGGQCRNGNPGGSAGSARRRQDDGRRAG